MNFNPLPFILLAYKMTHDSFKIAERAIKTREAKQRLLQRTCVEKLTLTDALCMIKEANKEIG
ncbi:MAG: hypothetical protein DRQ49_08220 [Gammaproteobacteria bacterium]|nr:MAG: hypothetical protein DRQ41_10820 [Gammaproteobacteria bacterium]RKZ40483.1 MAG: hypothetical protein DRQ49_08220 [Gammaproteobacteria bacterium]RKZ73137.1 MAG: hypothetical protein DRQ57_15325 [Gammaproteobacteria bacterium]